VEDVRLIIVDPCYFIDLDSPAQPFWRIVVKKIQRIKKLSSTSSPSEHLEGGFHL
jgi:hypothetical protein